MPQKPGPPKFVVDKPKLRKLAAKGITKAAIAARLGCSLSVLMDRQTTDPEISEIINEARASMQEEVADVLLDNAKKGDTAACRLILERRCGWREEKTIKHEHVTIDEQRDKMEQQLRSMGIDPDLIRPESAEKRTIN